MTSDFTSEVAPNQMQGHNIQDVLMYNRADNGKDVIRLWDPAESANEVPITQILAGCGFQVQSADTNRFQPSRPLVLVPSRR